MKQCELPRTIPQCPVASEAAGSLLSGQSVKRRTIRSKVVELGHCQADRVALGIRYTKPRMSTIAIYVQAHFRKEDQEKASKKEVCQRSQS